MSPRQNPPICDPPLYIRVSFDPIMLPQIPSSNCFGKAAYHRFIFRSQHF